MLTTTINELQLFYTVASSDTPATIATNIAKAINTSTATDPVTNLPLTSVVKASVSGTELFVSAVNPTTAFTLAVSLTAASYTAGRLPPPFAATATGGFLTDPTQKLFGHEPLLCAACNLTGAEFALICTALGFDSTTPLTLDHVSAVFRYGWLAHTLGLSVLVFLRLCEFSGLSLFPGPYPFAPLDPAPTTPAEPPIIRFIRLLQAMTAAGLQPVQALYLIWNQDISGTSAPPLTDITGLAFGLRADFAAVEAQFVLQDDPSGAIAQGLMALVYGATVTDFFFGLLNNTFSVATPYAYASPTLPQSVIDASGGLLAYDGLGKQLSFSGVLNGTTQAAIAAAAAVNTTDHSDNIAAGANVTLTPASMANIVPGTVLVIDSGAAQETVVVATTTATGFTTTTANAHNGTTTPFAIVNDPGFIAALASLEAASQQATAPFFTTYPELKPLHAAYAASTAPLQTRRTNLLASFLPTLTRIRKQEQALASITAAVGSDPSFANAVLQDPTILHADADPTAPAVSDLTAIEASGLSAQFFLGNNPTASPDQTVDAVSPVWYVQTATVSGTITAGVALTTTINGVAIGYTTTAADTSLGILAGNIAAAINAATTIDPSSKLPINRLVSAAILTTAAAGNVIAISGSTPMAANSLFSLTCTAPAGALGYAAGSQLPVGTANGPIAGIWSGYLTVPQNGDYNFAVVADAGAAVTLTIGGVTAAMALVGGVWLNQSPVALVVGALTPIVLTATSVKTTLSLCWQSPPGLGWQIIPGQYLYPANLMQRLGDTYVRFLKATNLASDLSLVADEIAWLGANPARTVNTTCATAVAAGSVQFTPQSMANIAIGSVLVVDTGAAQETVTVTATGNTTFTAVTTHAHDGTSSAFPIVGKAAPDIGLGWQNFLPGSPDANPVAAPNPDLPTAARLAKVLSALLDFSRIKQALSPSDERLLQLLQNPGAILPSGQSALISLTGWAQISVNALLSRFFNSTSPARLGDIEHFARVYDAYQIVQACRVTASTLIVAVSNTPTATSVNTLQSALRALYAEADWLTVVKPINDAIRILQRDALVAYILQGFANQPAPINAINTPDKLYEYFLIDPETQPPVETSRIRLALSTVQLFIERILRNLEPEVSPGDIDATQWQWMKRYRVWQANREVFLWPENWLYPELRDDQSPFFQSMMSSLLQSDITDDAATQAYLDYLTNLEEVAKLQPCGLDYVAATPDSNEISYVVARTAGAHRKYYFRQLQGGSWSPWAEVKIDCEDMPLTPIVWNGRLFLFWLKIHKQSVVAPGTAALAPADPSARGKGLTSAHIGDVFNAGPATAQAAGEVVLRAALCWSELYNGKWQPMKTSDFNRSANLGIFDPSGDNAFDAYRDQIRIVPAQATGDSWYAKVIGSVTLPALPDDVLILAISTPSNPFPSMSTIPGFLLHNTHSLPVPLVDVAVTAPWGTDNLGSFLDVPAPSRAMTPPSDPYSTAVAPYTGGNQNNKFSAMYYQTVHDFVSRKPPYTTHVMDFKWLPRVVDTQPGLADAWDAPFFYEDRRNQFYVTTTISFQTFAIYAGFAENFGVASASSYTAYIPPLSVQGPLTTVSPIAAKLSSGLSVIYQGQRIGVAGSLIDSNLDVVKTAG